MEAVLGLERREVGEARKEFEERGRVCWWEGGSRGMVVAAAGMSVCGARVEARRVEEASLEAVLGSIGDAMMNP